MNKTRKSKNKPKIFIASSSENLIVANALQNNLYRDIECTVWNQGVIRPSQYTLHGLKESFKKYDFAAFIFVPDDSANIRNKKVSIVRDNVLFELGLFVSLLDVERCFILIPDGVDVHLPTDILGITTIGYDMWRSDENIQAALGPAATQIIENARRIYNKKIGLNKKEYYYCGSYKVIYYSVVDDPHKPIYSILKINNNGKAIFINNIRCNSNKGEYYYEGYYTETKNTIDLILNNRDKSEDVMICIEKSPGNFDRYMGLLLAKSNTGKPVCLKIAVMKNNIFKKIDHDRLYEIMHSYKDVIYNENLIIINEESLLQYHSDKLFEPYNSDSSTL